MQWAMVIMSIERSVPPGTAKEFLEAYSIKLTATERGVMVIKKKDKTRASQRKGALSNWKVRKKIHFFEGSLFQFPFFIISIFFFRKQEKRLLSI